MLKRFDSKRVYNEKYLKDQLVLIFLYARMMFSLQL